MRFYRPQHEQGMVHVASAFAKHRNRLATFACTSSIGPGALNMVTGAGVATVNRLPVLLLPSDYFANRVPDPVLQQIEHPLERDVSANDAFRPVSRFFDRISRPEQLLASLPEAFRVLTDPAETGAVTISLPEDVQAEAFHWPTEFFQKRVWHVRRPLPEPELIREVVRRLQDAKRPILITGGGTIYSEAWNEVGQLAEAFGIPVVETQAGKGALRWDHPWNTGAVGSNGATSANELAKEADLILAVGTRLTDFTTASRSQFQNPEVRFVGINVSPMDASKLSTLPVVADAKRALPALSQALREAGYPGTAQEYRTQVRETQNLPGDQHVDGDPHGGRRGRSPAGRDRGHRPGERRRRWESHRRVRRREHAGRAAPALAAGGPKSVSPGVRLLLHGLRDPRRHRRQAGRTRARGGRHDRRRHLPDDETRRSSPPSPRGSS